MIVEDIFLSPKKFKLNKQISFAGAADNRAADAARFAGHRRRREVHSRSELPEPDRSVLGGHDADGARRSAGHERTETDRSRSEYSEAAGHNGRIVEGAFSGSGAASTSAPDTSRSFVDDEPSTRGRTIEQPAAVFDCSRGSAASSSTSAAASATASSTASGPRRNGLSADREEDYSGADQEQSSGRRQDESDGRYPGGRRGR